MSGIRVSLALILAVCSGIAAAQTQTPSAQADSAGQQTTGAAAATGKSQTSTEALSSTKLTPQQKVLLEQADQLVALAQQLKTEVDKSNQYTLSLNSLRRTDDIEKLAKSLQKQIERRGH